MIYEGCSKSIEPLVGRSIFIDLEIQNFNPHQSSYTLPPALLPFLETLLELSLWNGVQLVHCILQDVLS